MLMHVLCPSLSHSRSFVHSLPFRLSLVSWIHELFYDHEHLLLSLVPYKCPLGSLCIYNIYNVIIEVIIFNYVRPCYYVVTSTD